MPVVLTTWEKGVGRIAVGHQLRQKVHETPSQPGCDGMHPNYSGSIDKRIIVQDNLVINARVYLKNNESKKGWRLP
jgi:hypothetical protein